jgi:hypothetical protein
VRTLFAGRRLALAQDHRHRFAAYRIIDVDRQKAALVVMGVEQRELLMAVHRGIVDVERDRGGTAFRLCFSANGKMSLRKKIIVELLNGSLASLAWSAGRPTRQPPKKKRRPVEGAVVNKRKEAGFESSQKDRSEYLTRHKALRFQMPWNFLG